MPVRREPCRQRRWTPRCPNVVAMAMALRWALGGDRCPNGLVCMIGRRPSEVLRRFDRARKRADRLAAGTDEGVEPCRPAIAPPSKPGESSGAFDEDQVAGPVPPRGACSVSRTRWAPNLNRGSRVAYCVRPLGSPERHDPSPWRSLRRLDRVVLLFDVRRRRSRHRRTQCFQKLAAPFPSRQRVSASACAGPKPDGHFRGRRRRK
jgi:hypothetical protein